MFDLEQLVATCRSAGRERQAPLAVKEVLARAVMPPEPLAAAASGAPVGLNILYRASDLTVVNAVWPPHVSLFPHDHRMWAVIAVYGGTEENAFYRRQGSSIVRSGGQELREGDVLLLGHDAIHAVRNPRRGYTGAIHVYGGDFAGVPRSQWDEAQREQPFDLANVQREIVRAEQLFERVGGGGEW